jgi:hypothetical protein
LCRAGASPVLAVHPQHVFTAGFRFDPILTLGQRV